MRRLTALALLLLAITAAASAQTVSMGSIPGSPNTGFSATSSTEVDLAFPASAAGNMTLATFVWQSAPCPGAAKIKFFRPSGVNLIFLAERGPFDVNSLTQTVTLSPGVSVQAGDLIGITRVAGACGTPVAAMPGGSQGLIAFSGDVSADIPRASGLLVPSAFLAVQAIGGISAPPGQALVGVIPVAVSSPGLNGSFFRTAVQAYNPGTTAITGSFLFRPQGSTSTPSLAYSINPGQTTVFADLLTAMSTSGVGSVDVVASGGTSAPVLAVRVYNDGGAAGTTGFTENAKKPVEFLGAGSIAVLLAPFDVTSFRFNIGVRTLNAATSITVTVRDTNGNQRKTLTATYPTNFFQQTDAATFLGGLALSANDSITVTVNSGGLIVYGVTADNKTNDPAIQDTQPVVFIPPTVLPTL
jgi:hypothetical protein